MPKFLLPFILLLPICLASDNNDTTRVILGVPCSTIHMNLDYVVSISLDWGFHFCGGALLNPTHVLTAAHCFDDHSDNTLVVLFKDTPDKRWSSKVKYIFPHPEYNEYKVLNDIGIAVLSSPVPASFKLKFADLIGHRIIGPIERYCSQAMLVGWGYIDDDKHQSDSMMCAMIPVVDVNFCTKKYGDESFADTWVCTYSEEGKDGCQGDSGAPLICPRTGKVIAVHSSGMGCGNKRIPSISTRVDAYLRFIEGRSAAVAVRSFSYLIAVIVVLY